MFVSLPGDCCYFYLKAMTSAKNFICVCGQDDFLTSRLGKERFETLATDVQANDLSREIVNGLANNTGEVETAVNRFRDALKTVPMFGGKRAVWFKDINFLADTVTGRAEDTQRQVQALQELLEEIDPGGAAVVMTASPIDRRRSFMRWLEGHSDFTLVGGGEASGEALAEAKRLGTSFDGGAVELLLTKVGANSRLIIEEVHKLATYVGEGAVIEEGTVAELTPNVAEWDFFEAVDRFFADDLSGELDALQKHFFSGGDARPIIAALQRRNRILLQVRVLMDVGGLGVPSKRFGFDKSAWARAKASYAKHFGGDEEKSSFNLFTQNQWYAGKLVGGEKLPPPRRLIDNQQEFVRAFEEIIRRSSEQEQVLREMILRCLSA